MSYKSGIINGTPKCCKGCFYRTYLSSNVSVCDYAAITGELRNCPPEECTYYLKKKRRKKELTYETFDDPL